MKNSEIKQWIFCLTVCSVLGGCAQKQGEILWEQTAGATEIEAESGMDGLRENMTETAAHPATVVVDVSGAVVRPGVYELEEGARVCDAIEMAGGLLENADVNLLNQAVILNDADKITVYTVEEAGQVPAQGAAMTSGAQKVNINQADITELCTLRGIGEARAKDIVAYREANGKFQSIEEIMNVSGIKEATFEKIKDEIAVR